MKHNDQQELQKLLKQKQTWIQSALRELQNNNYKEAVQFVNFDGGCNISIQKILESYIPEENAG